MAPTKRARRVPRDSAGNLWRQPACRVDGNCPEDVRNKFTNQTPADKILQYGSTVINLGGLGIGTGSGGGGRGGYIPLDAGRGIGVGAWPRPSYPTRVPTLPPVETIVPDLPVIPDVVAPDIIELEPILPPRHPSVIDELAPVGPEDPSIVEDFGSVPGRPAIIDESLPTTGGNRIEVVAEVHHPAELFPVQPTTAGGSSTSAILEVGEHIPLMPRSLAPHIHDPAILEVTTSFGTAADLPGARASFIDFGAAEEAVGEEIPLLDRTYDPESDLVFRSSTPTSTSRPLGRLKSLYNRWVKQVPIEDPLLLQAPARLVEFGNPAYEGDDTIEFPSQGESPLASPDSRFQGIRKLHRAIVAESPFGRRLRLSRLGQVGAMRMRSGVSVGPRVHLFHDISSINNETIELTPLGVHPSASSAGEHVIEDTTIDVLTEEDDPEFGFEEVPLLDRQAGQTQRIGVGSGGRGNRNPVNLEIPTTTRAESYGVNIGTESDIYVHYHDDEDTGFVPGQPLMPVVPTYEVEDDNTLYDYWFDFYLHIPRKKRKRCSFCSFTDGYVDT